MTSDEIRQRFTAITLLLNPFAFILGIMPLLARYAIGHVPRGESRMIDYAQINREDCFMQPLAPDPQRLFRARNVEALQTELSNHKSSDKIRRPEDFEGSSRNGMVLR